MKTLLIERKGNGDYRCLKCSLEFDLARARAHGLFFHRIPPDHLAQDGSGNFHDTRGASTPELLRELGGI